MYDDLNRRQKRVEVNTRVGPRIRVGMRVGGRKMTQRSPLAHTMAQLPGRGGNTYEVLAQPLQGSPLGCVPGCCRYERLSCQSHPRTRASARPQHPSPAAAHTYTLHAPLTRVCFPSVLA